MKTLLAVLILGCASRALGAAPLSDKSLIKSGATEVAVRYIGHASLILEHEGKVIHIDPVGREGDYAALPKADLVLVTHEHFDHFDPAAIERLVKPGTEIILNQACRDKLGKGTVLGNGGTATVQGVRVEAVPAYNIISMRSPGVPFHPRGQGNGYVLTLGEARVYVAGDSEATPEMKALKGIDAAFLPVMTPYTMSPEMAAQAVGAFRPHVVFPYHSSDEFLAKTVSLLEAVPGADVRILKKK
jgi:L-ascorbate metabolism protein UlaG (beta-lactamase superfamily)